MRHAFAGFDAGSSGREKEGAVTTPLTLIPDFYRAFAQRFNDEKILHGGYAQEA